MLENIKKAIRNEVIRTNSFIDTVDRSCRMCENPHNDLRKEESNDLANYFQY